MEEEATADSSTVPVGSSETTGPATLNCSPHDSTHTREERRTEQAEGDSIALGWGRRTSHWRRPLLRRLSRTQPRPLQPLHPPPHLTGWTPFVAIPPSHVRPCRGPSSSLVPLPYAPTLSSGGVRV
jgi:hypothetical protein